MKMAHDLKELSPDSQTKVGALLLSSKGNIIAGSYNGFVQDAIDNILPDTRPDKYEYMQHAERNMVYNCANEGIRTRGTYIVCTLSPCLECLRACYRSGIEMIYFDELYHKFPDTDFYKSLKDIHVLIEKRGNFTALQLIGMNYALERGWIDQQGNRLR